MDTGEEDTNSKTPAQPIEAEQSLIKEVKKRYKDCEDWEANARVLFEYDYKFANGDTHNKYQWDTDLVNSRELEDRPCLTINKTQVHNLLVINDAKQNKPGVRIRPVGDDASYEGAQIYQELVYHIEYISSAESVYDYATVFQVEAGMGYWRIQTDYISNDVKKDGVRVFDQELYIRKIKDPRSVYLDPNINEDDGSDARFGFIFEDMPKDLFRETYPDFASIAGSSVLNNSSSDGWITRDNVRVCEYYKKVQKKEIAVTFLDPKSREQITAYRSELSSEGIELANQLKKARDPSYQERKLLTDNIHWYKIAGDRIVDDGPWLGKYIPIVRLPGTETVIDGILDRKGHTRALINAQQIYNYNCLSLDTVLPTPNGWTTINDVKPDDYLIADDGKPTKVLDVSPVNINRKCFEIEFDDGSSLIADENHLWTIERRFREYASNSKDWIEYTLPTKDLQAGKDYIWCVKPFSLPKNDLLIDPYVLGVWLGDGSTGTNRFTCDKSDANNMISNLSNRGYEIGDVRECKGKAAVDVTIHGLRNHLSVLGLLGNKHIPSNYLRASYEQRVELLQGLMDTDGHVHKNVNQCIFVNTNIKLISSLLELLRSLGIKPVVKQYEGKAAVYPNGEIYTRQNFYRVTFTTSDVDVFKLNRKSCVQKKIRNTHERRTKRFKIVSIVEVPSVPVKCLTVDAPSKLFLAGVGMVPTHNTSANVEYGALQTKSPWVAPSEAIEGFEEYYKTANTTNHSYLPYNHMGEDGNPIPPPSRPAAPQASPAYVEQMKIAQNEMMMVTGQYQSQLGENENAKSGVAINARQRQGDKVTYHFIDNLAKAIRITGKILIDLIPKIYDTKRIKQIMATDGSILDLTIDPDAQQGYQKLPTPPEGPKMVDGKQVEQIIFNPNFGIYDIQADTGPSYATKRMEAVAALTQVAAADKNFMNIGGDIYFDMLDFPKADVLAKRYYQLIPPNVKGEGLPPEIENTMHQASDKIEQLTALVKQQGQELADKQRELDIKEQQIKLNEKIAEAEQARLDYDAETKRLTAIGNSGPAVSVEQVQPVVRNLLQGMLNAGEPGNEHVIPTKTVGDIADENATLEPPEGQEQGTGEEELTPEDMPENAKRAPDGNYYVPHGNGFARVELHG